MMQQSEEENHGGDENNNNNNNESKIRKLKRKFRKQKGRERWMYHMRSLLRTQRVRDTFLPGTHDSGAYQLTTSSPLAPDAPSIAHTLHRSSFSSLHQLNQKYVKRVTSNWAITQHRTIYEQLKEGIRYLDLRVCKLHPPSSPPGELGRGVEGEEMFYVCHALAGESFVTIFKQIIQFITENQKWEIIVLDFNHFYAMSKFDHSIFKRVISHYLSPYIFPHHHQSVSISHLTFNHLWSSHKQLIIFYDEIIDKSLPPNMITPSNSSQSIINNKQQQHVEPILQNSSQHLNSHLQQSNDQHISEDEDLQGGRRGGEEEEEDGDDEKKIETLFWPPSKITSPWHDKISSTKLIKCLDFDIQRGLPEDKLHIFQCILTPRLSTIMTSLTSSLYDLTRRNNPKILGWLFSLPLHQLPLNIIIIDHYHDCSEHDFVLSLLYANILKHTSPHPLPPPQSTPSLPTYQSLNNNNNNHSNNDDNDLI